MIVFEEFGICFFEKHDPDLWSVISAEDRSIVMKREIVIDDHTLPESINEEPYSIVAIGAGLGSFKKSFNDKGVLADSSQR